MRSKTRAIQLEGEVKPADLPEWSFDGSSTNQAEGYDSDCILKPACVVSDPIYGEDNILVLCEAHNPDGTPHTSNTRVKLRHALDNGGAEHEPWLGFEQ
jgi:glutamine synthetase